MLKEPNPSLQLLPLSEIRIKHGLWANRNFRYHAPHLGIIEEVGELSHTILKHTQGIRGVDESTVVPMVMDALCDITLFTLHLQFIAGIKTDALTMNNLWIHQSICDELGEMAILAGRISHEVGELVRSRNYNVAISIPDFEGKDLEALTFSTFAMIFRADQFAKRFGVGTLTAWLNTVCQDEVWPRDFVRYPSNGLPPKVTIDFPGLPVIEERGNNDPMADLMEGGN